MPDTLEFSYLHHGLLRSLMFYASFLLIYTASAPYGPFCHG